MEKKFQPFLKLCLSLAVVAPTKEDISSLLRTQFSSSVTHGTISEIAGTLLEIHNGDLRKILQTTREVREKFESGGITVEELKRTILDSYVESHALSTNRIRRAETKKTAVGQLLRGQ